MSMIFNALAKLRCPLKRDHFKTHTIHGTGIFTYIWLNFMVNVGKHTIHGCYGKGKDRLTTHHFSEDMLVFRGVISILEVDGKQLAG